MPDHVIVQAFTAVEIEHMAIISGKTDARGARATCKAAGLDALPGGGAEIFRDRTRLAAWDKKTKSDVWLRIHGEAHELGITTNCTMLYGHIETHEERVDHLIRLREQQDKTGGFLAFIPLAFHPANTELADLPATTGFDDLKTLAIARLMLDNIPHIKAFWIMLGLKVAQISTAFGVDDLDGTVVEERITHMAGATTPEALSKDDLVGMIAETGHVAGRARHALPHREALRRGGRDAGVERRAHRPTAAGRMRREGDLIGDTMRALPSGHLDKRVIASWRVSRGVWTGVISLVLILAAAGGPVLFEGSLSLAWLLAAVALSACIVAVFVVAVPHVRYRTWRYEVTDDEIDIRKGVFVHTRIIVPLVRVQHVNTTQGPILRAFGLASVSVATAAGEQEIPGLSVEEAEKLRDRVAVLARLAQEDV